MRWTIFENYIQVLQGTSNVLTTEHDAFQDQRQNSRKSAILSEILKKTLWRAKKERFFLPKISIGTLTLLSDTLKSSRVPGSREILRTHRHSKEAYSHLNARDSHEDVFDTVLHKPVVAAPGKAKAENVFEDEETGEGFDRNFA